MRSDGDTARAVAAAVEELGGLDVLVCNAGTGLVSPLAETSPDQLNLILDVNVTGCLRYARACLPHLEQRRGAMIHIASDAGVIGEDPIGAYSVSKAAVIMLGKMLAVDCGRARGALERGLPRRHRARDARDARAGRGRARRRPVVLAHAADRPDRRRRTSRPPRSSSRRTIRPS